MLLGTIARQRGNHTYVLCLSYTIFAFENYWVLLQGNSDKDNHCYLSLPAFWISSGTLYMSEEFFVSVLTKSVGWEGSQNKIAPFVVACLGGFDDTVPYHALQIAEWTEIYYYRKDQVICAKRPCVRRCLLLSESTWHESLFWIIGGFSFLGQMMGCVGKTQQSCVGPRKTSAQTRKRTCLFARTRQQFCYSYYPPPLVFDALFLS